MLKPDGAYITGKSVGETTVSATIADVSGSAIVVVQ